MRILLLTLLALPLMAQRTTRKIKPGAVVNYSEIPKSWKVVKP